MTQTLDQRTYTPGEYLEFEVNSEERHEYINGEIIQVSGGTPNHNKIALNVATALNFALKRQPYEVFVTDQRLWIPEKRIYPYPDIMVMIPPLEYAEGRRDTLTNPLMIVEVLSKSTEAYDRGDKFAAYRTFSSFQEYVLINQYTLQVEQYTRIEPQQWTFLEYTSSEAILSFSSVPVQVELLDIYDKVDFETEDKNE